MRRRDLRDRGSSALSTDNRDDKVAVIGLDGDMTRISVVKRVLRGIDVFPGGFAALLGEGVIRVRNRDRDHEGGFTAERLSKIEPVVCSFSSLRRACRFGLQAVRRREVAS